MEFAGFPGAFLATPLFPLFPSLSPALTVTRQVNGLAPLAQDEDAAEDTA